MLVCLSIVLSLGYAAVPVAGAAVPDGESVVFPQQTPTENNSTVVHENPENASSSEDLEDVREWLSNRMANAVIDCTRQVQAGSSYACRQLDRDYPDWAGRYVEVRRNDAGTAESTDRTLNRTRTDAQTFAEDVETFRELRTEYEAARAAGNEERSRELAHRLVRQSREINRTASRVTSNYDAFSNTTSENLSVASDAVVEIEQNTTTAAEEIREAELVSTTLSAEATRARGSFASPIVVAGRLVSENGTAVSDRQIRLQIGNGTATTATDAEGAFSVRYRPTTERRGASDLTVRYLPTNTSLYGPSDDEVRVTVIQEQATVTVNPRPSTVAFGDALTVAGRVEAAGRGVGDVPVVVSLGGGRLGTARTDETGDYSLNVSVPAAVSEGTAQVVAGLPFEGRALAAADASTTVSIESTATTLSLRGNRTGAGAVRLDGRLETDSGPLAGREVELAVNGSTIGVARTGPDGRFSTETDLPSAVAASDSVVVTATYSPAGESLDPASARVTLGSTASDSSTSLGAFISNEIRDIIARLTGSPSDASGGISRQFTGAFQLGAAAFAVASLSVLGLLFVRRREPLALARGLLGGGEKPEQEHEGPRDVAVEELNEATVLARSPPSETSLLTTARERLSRGDTDAAVLAGYEAVRRRLADRLERDSPMTHWELLRSYESNSTREDAGSLRQLTEAYQRAAFSLQASSEETARMALDNAERLLDTFDGDGESADSGRN
ncbi:hypothetical protein NDI76_16240 [Halogeometricum sp. S1BR25-6]|uniref:DUF4129 domain-containing protein n=1 Tax=Halogeometricum salsisoli TaxID=2950536 RepID=A0ABU2GHL3_9EURY|nr:hypothetical protein [Halogeometricum sp. S1BR25-6]MDS0300297.1 hypothetical protein [Halogeometricum sp. S1BR25-6]